jgi:glycosyltransferase involved in cell wall biosynthesis
VRFLLAVHNAYTEYTSGAARSMRAVMEWLAADGHTCHVLSTGAFESRSGAMLEAHLAELGIASDWSHSHGPCRENNYVVAGVSVTAIDTKHNDPANIDVQEGRQYFARLKALIRDVRPDTVISYGPHPVLQAALEAAQAERIATVFTVRSPGYEEARWFRHTDRVLTAGSWLAGHYARRIGLRCSGLPSPIIWPSVQTTDDARGFLTFINASPAKGAALFARLADRLGQARPDIPILIVHSNEDAAALVRIHNLNLSQYPQIMMSPPVADIRAIYAMTKILLVPSLFDEPTGRVAAEAMINGIPAIVSDRGGLPDTVADGGVVVPVPAWMGPQEKRIPAAHEVQPWFDAVTRLWDDPVEYDRVAVAARTAAHRLYDEPVLRRRYDAFFTAPGPRGDLFPADFRPAAPESKRSCQG